MLRNQPDHLTLLDCHRTKNELQANFLVVVLYREQLRLVEVLLLVRLEGVTPLHVEAKFVQLLVGPEAVSSHVVDRGDQMDVGR